jgi:UrcA family protein
LPHPSIANLLVTNSEPEGSLLLSPIYCQREIHKEIYMYINAAFKSALPVLGATLVACTMFAGDVAAKDQEFPVDYRVNARGLDLSQPAGAQELYARLQHAAEVVCTHGMRVDLVPLADPKGCYEQALGAAVRTANAKLVTKAYLATHTREEAAERGIDVRVQIAAK